MKAQSKIWIVLLATGLGTLKLAAENAPAPQAPAATSQPQSQIQRVKVFDDRVFELGIDKPAPPTTSKSGQSGTERWLADEEDVNSGQRAQWKEKCAGAPDARTQRDCYAKERQKGVRELREKFNNRNSNSLSSPWQGEDKRGKGLPKE